ncbi:Amidophosphoribosyltransferase, partial [Chlamydiales bacterium SCGC AG-110-M15]
MCGVLGIYGDEDVFPELAYGLTTLQHRGQDSAGIVTFDYAFHVEKGKGYASQVFVDEKAANLKGSIGLGHIRYTTQGDPGLCNAQPFTVNYPFGLAMVHNGNVTNFEDLKRDFVNKHFRLLQSTNDIELILDMLALELERKNLPRLTVEDIFSAVKVVQEKVHGAYATLTLIANRGMLAFMDPHGIRPLLLGRKETEKGVSYAFASESTCLDYLAYEVIHTLQPGEAVFIDSNKKVHSRICYQKKQAFCVFEYVFGAKEDSVVYDRLIAAEREKMGHALGKRFREQGLEPDVVIDVPSSAYFCAQGLADALGVPYKRALVKNNHANRSFISPTQKLREK